MLGSRLTVVSAPFLAVWLGIAAPQRAWAEDGPAQQVLKDYVDRLPAMRRELPVIVRAAEAVAARRVAHPDADIMIIRDPNLGFGYELVSRSGGLVDIHHERGLSKKASSNDVVLGSIRAWDSDAALAAKAFRRCREKGCMVVLFASRQGMPTNFPADFVVDNGAVSGASNAAPINVLVNASSGWAWCCEYTAALTRLGKRPGILKSKSYPDGDDFNAPLKADRRKLYDTDTAIPAKVLGEAYLARIEKMTADIASPPVMGPILRAVDIAADRAAKGKLIYAATCNHLLAPEISRDFPPMVRPIRPYNGGFGKSLKAGDLLIWFGYIGMNTASYQHGTEIRATKADFIACIAPVPNGSEKVDDALVVIPQSWDMGDAEVEIPFPPGRMAPVSGINQTLIYRMFNAALADRVAHAGIVSPVPAKPATDGDIPEQE